MRAEKLPTRLMICPYNDATSYAADSADPQSRSNFTDYQKNLSYSFANPYPDDAATKDGYRFNSRLGANIAVAADLRERASIIVVRLGKSGRQFDRLLQVRD